MRRCLRGKPGLTSRKQALKRRQRSCIELPRREPDGPGEPTKHESKVIGIQRACAIRLDPILTGEEAIVLRALACGLNDRQVCNQLRMNPEIYLRMMRDMREKIGKPDSVSLVA
jgi:DNA-binding NarL/FixJ family response regulator